MTIMINYHYYSYFGGKAPEQFYLNRIKTFSVAVCCIDQDTANVKRHEHEHIIKVSIVT